MTAAERWGPTGLVFAVTLLTFLPVINNGWLQTDDLQMVWANPGVLQGLSLKSIHWAFTTSHFGMWHPLTWVGHQLDVTLWGKQPAGHHFDSALTHALCATVFFSFLRRATGLTARSLLASLLFALHPLRVESVAWIAERKDVLCTLFCVVSLWLYAWYRARPSAGRWVALTGAIAAAMLSKPMAVTLPFVLLLCDVWPLGPAGRWRTRVLEKLPWLGLVALTSAFTVAYQERSNSLGNFPWSDRLLHVPLSCGLELWHTVYPAHLSYLYPRVNVEPGPLLASIAGLAALLVSAWWMRARWPSWAVGVAWFLGVIFPTSGLLQSGSGLTANRFTYFAHAGLFAGLVFALPQLPADRRRTLYIGLAVALLTACVAKDLAEIATWHDSEAVFQKALERDPDNTRALSALGTLYLQQGREAEGVALYRRVLTLAPGDGFTRANYALSLLARGESAAALVEATRARADFPGNDRVEQTYARALMANHRDGEAMPLLRQLLARAPFDLMVGFDLGLALADLGRTDEAIAAFDSELLRFPDSVELRVSVTAAAQGLGRTGDARRYLAQGLRLAPEDPRLKALQAQLNP